MQESHIDRLRNKINSHQEPKITYQNRSVGTVYHPAESIDMETIDAFERIAKKVPGTYYHELNGIQDCIYPVGSKVAIPTNDVICAAAKSMEDSGRPTLSYNNGMFCFVGYKTVAKTEETHNVRSAVYLFTDVALAERLKKELGQMKSGYVPCSNMESWRCSDDPKDTGRFWINAIQKETENSKNSFLQQLSKIGDREYPA